MWANPGDMKRLKSTGANMTCHMKVLLSLLKKIKRHYSYSCHGTGQRDAPNVKWVKKTRRSGGGGQGLKREV